MLQALSSELLGRVIALLPERDLQAARRASRAFDAAARVHSGSISTLKLTSANTKGGDVVPDFARFPRLRRLVLGDLPADTMPRLRLALQRRAAPLACVEEIDAAPDGGHACLDTGAWVALLAIAPEVSRIRLPEYPLSEEASTERLALAATIGALAPRLAALDARQWRCVDDRAAAVVSRSMAALRELRLQGGAEPVPWAALPCARLTALHFEYVTVVPNPVADGASWPQLRALEGVVLTPGLAAALARGLPNLQRLNAHLWPGPVWDELPAGEAAATSVTSAYLTSSGLKDAFFKSQHLLARMFPNVEDVEIRSSDGVLVVASDLGPLTRLTRLEAPGPLIPTGWAVRLQAATWASLSKLTQLRTLAVDIGAGQLPLLAKHMPPGVDALGLRVVARLDDGGATWVLPDADGGASAFAMSSWQRWARAAPTQQLGPPHAWAGCAR